MYLAAAAVQSDSNAVSKLVPLFSGKSSAMLSKFLPHFAVLVAGLVLAWYFDTFSFGPFTYISKKKPNAADELLRKKHQVVGNECIPETNTCFLIVDSYYLENSRLTTKRDLLLGDHTEYSLTGVEVESNKPVSWENIDSRNWPVNKLVINARYARLLVAAGFIMDSLNFDENDHHDVLIGGLGGGVMSNFLSEISYLNIDTTVVEKEEFVIDVAERYFDHFETEHLKVVHGDFVEFIRTNDKKYDVIIVDACENTVADIMCPVSRILTSESIKLLKKRLTLEGTLAVNIYISKDLVKHETTILNLFSEEFKSCFYLEYFKNKKLFEALERLVRGARGYEELRQQFYRRLRLLNIALQIRILEYRVDMINQHNQPAQLVNVQRPHQIQPPLRLVPAQNLPQGQPVAIRIQGEPINIQQAQLMNVQGQRQLIAQAPMQQQQQAPQIQQAQLMGMGQQIRQPIQQQQQMHHGQNQGPQQQVRGNPQQNQQQMRGMVGGAPHQQGQQQQAQMRMQQNQQMMNGPNGQQAAQQRMQTQSNMQQNQQMRIQPGQLQQQSQMQIQHPSQQQMQQRQQSPINQQQQQQMPQRQMMANGPQEPIQLQQPMRDHHLQMQPGQSNMGGPPQQQNRMQHQMPHEQQKMQQVGSQNMNGPSPQPQQQMQQGHQNQNMNGPPGQMQQNMRVQQHMPQGQQNSQGMNSNQPMHSHQPPALRGQMQNSPQMRMQQQQQQFQSSPQQAQPIQPRTLQPIAPGRSTPQMHQQQQRQQQMPINRNIQQGPPSHQNQIQEQHQQAPQAMQLPTQAVIQDSGMIRIKGNHAIINGTEFRLMQVQPGSEANGQIQLVNANPDQNSGVAQSIQLQRVELPPGGLQKVTLQHRSSSHQLLPPAQVSSSMPQMQRGPPMEQQTQQQQKPMMQQNPPMQNQQQQGMHNMQQRPPSQQSQHQQQPQQPQQPRQAPLPQRAKPPPKPRNRSKKNNADVDQNQAQQSQQPPQQQQQHDMNAQINGPAHSMSGTSSGPPPQTGTPQKARGRVMLQQNAQMGQPGPPDGMRNDRNFSPNPQMVQQGKHMVQIGGMPPDVQRGPQTPAKNMPRNQQQMKPGQPSNQRPNGKMPFSRNPSSSIPPDSHPSTSQASSSRQKPLDPTDMTVIKDAIVSHVRGIRKMTPQYIKYVCDELSRIIHEMEKAELTSDSRYVSTQRLLALVKGENASKVETPVREKRPERPSPDDKLDLPDEPTNESPESRKRRYDGYLNMMTNAYPLKPCNVKFARLDDETIRKEAANYMKQDMKNRAAFLKENLHKFPEHLQTKAKIEYHGLNLIELQEKVRKEVEATLVFEPPTEFLINPWSIRRSKVEYAQELKQHPDRAVLERKRRITNNLLLHTLAKHTREFRDFHKGLMNKHQKVRKAMQTHITNEAKRRTREELKNEKLRIQKLILEDEDGYRAMLDDKKDQRLVYLLQQTDGYIESLTELLKKQKNGGESVTMRNFRKDFAGEIDDVEVKTILNKARNEDDDDEDKTKNNFEDYYATAHGIREEIKEQHKTMGGENTGLKLKPYQLKGLEWMVSLFNNNLNGILADEMGLGKTIQTIAFITYLMEIKKTNGPFLVIVPLSTLSNWKNEFDKWAPHVSLLVYKGPKDGRKAIEPIIKSGKFNVLLTTFEYVIREKALLGKLRWKYMIIDEGHRLKNQHCKLTEMLNTRFQCQRRLLITGTPLQNKLPELWALLNFLLPAIFSSCSTFEQWFNAPFATTGEKVELTQEETMLIIRRLHKVLRPFLLRRLKKEVESELPDKMEFVIRCDMSALQKVLYKHMQKGLLLDGKQNTGSRTLMNSMVHLRKLCNHPFLFPNVEDSCRIFWKIHCATGTDLCRVAGKLELLDRVLPKLQASGHRVLMFFQMTAMMNIIEDYFTARAINYLRLDGSTKPDERGVLLDKFNAPGSQYFLFMLSTRAGGLGLNLQTADTVIIFDSDWNPHQDMQAQDRAHRIGQKAEVRVFRLITANSVEEKILAAARFKLNVDEKVIQAGKFDNRSTGEERKRMLEAIIKAENESEEDDEIPSDEDINDMLSRTDEEYELFQKMDQERYENDARTGAKPRLVCQDEIPKDILRAADETDYQEKAKEEGREAYLEVMPGSRRKRKDVDYSADSMSDDKFLEKLFDGEDLAPERKGPREEPLVVKPDVAPENPSLTFKVPRLVFKFGEEAKRKHKKSENDSVSKNEKSPKKQKKDNENRKEKSEKLKQGSPIEKLKIKLALNPDSLLSNIGETPRKRAHEDGEGSSRKQKVDEDSTPKKKKKRRDSEDVESSEKKKHKHKHKKHDDLESTVRHKDVPSTSGPSTTSTVDDEVQPPLKLKLPKLIIKMPPGLSEAVANEEQKKEHRKRDREEETEEERKARKAAKKEKKRLLAEQEEQTRAQEKLAKKARKEQRRLEKEKLQAAGSAGKVCAVSTTAPATAADSLSNEIVIID